MKIGSSCRVRHVVCNILSVAVRLRCSVCSFMPVISSRMRELVLYESSSCISCVSSRGVYDLYCLYKSIEVVLKQRQLQSSGRV